MGVVVVAIIAGVIWLMMRIVRAARERRREAWRAGGSVGTGPGSGCSGGGGCGGGGCGGGGCGGGGGGAEAAEAEVTERAGAAWGATAFRAISRPFLIGRALGRSFSPTVRPLGARGSARHSLYSARREGRNLSA
jgi:hypothetical protein